MSANLVIATAIYGRTGGVVLNTTGSFTILNNPNASNETFKVNTLNVANSTATAANITIFYVNGAGLVGTQFNIVGTVAVPAYSTLNVIDKSNQYYLEANSSLGAVAGTANALTVTVSYEDIV